MLLYLLSQEALEEARFGAEEHEFSLSHSAFWMHMRYWCGTFEKAVELIYKFGAQKRNLN